MKKAEGRRQRAEGSLQMGILTPPEDEPLKEFQWGLETLVPFGHQRAKDSRHHPSAFCHQASAFLGHLSLEEHEIGKRKTQRIERKHLTLRTRIKRLARKTICFSKTREMHDLVIGLFINRYEFGLNV